MDLRWLRGRHLFLLDLVIIAGSIVGAMLLRFDSLRFAEDALIYFPAALFPLVVRPPINVAGGLYSRAWAYASVGELARIIVVVIAGTIAGIAVLLPRPGAAGVVGTVTGVGPFPRSFFVLEGLLTLAGMGGSRFLIRRPPIGRLAAGIRDREVDGAEAGGPDARLRRRRRRGHGPPDDRASRPTGSACGSSGCSTTTARKRNQILRGAARPGRHRRAGRDRPCDRRPAPAHRDPVRVRRRSSARRSRTRPRSGLETRTVPALDDLVSRPAERDRHPRGPGRRPAAPRAGRHRRAGLRELVAGQTVLVTGAGGSIGSELARQVFDLDPGAARPARPRGGPALRHRTRAGAARRARLRDRRRAAAVTAPSWSRAWRTSPQPEAMGRIMRRGPAGAWSSMRRPTSTCR